MPTINTWIQDTEPSPVSPFDVWILPTAGQRFSRDKTNSRWIFKGYTEQAFAGAMPTSGGATTGNFTGATGWAPSSSADISTSLRRDGFDIARQIDLDTLKRDVYAFASSRLTSVIGSQNSLTSVSENLAWGVGTVSLVVSGNVITQPFVIPVPVFQGNTPATVAQCVMAQAFLVNVGRNVNGTEAYHMSTSPSVPAPAVTLDWNIYGAVDTPQPHTVEITVGYFVVAVR